jgi:cytochrome c-type biogenesis protein
MSLLADVVESFALGVATPLTAACALPLYPGFVAYLASKSEDGISPALLGGSVVGGVLAFMLGVGLLFATVLQSSLTGVVETVSPLAFVVLAVISVGLLLDVSLFERFPSIEPPGNRRPVVAAFAYGAFFGAIVIPCNPGFFAYYFARALLFDSPAASVLNAGAFGLGIGAPLLGLAVVSEARGRRFTRAIARHRTPINRISGAIMLAVSLYYLLVVFDVIGVAGTIPL